MISVTPFSSEYLNRKGSDQAHQRRPVFPPTPLRRPHDVAEREPQARSRPVRGTNEAGLQKIVDGMRLALRTRNTIHITRKDVADCAHVTPALVTYYFPQREDLIEAVTVPIVQTMVDAVELCLNGGMTAQQKLLSAVQILIASFARDAAIIDLFAFHRASRAAELPDGLAKIESGLLAFFEDWLKQSQDCVYDAVYLQKATIGMCKIVARRERPEAASDNDRERRLSTLAEAICAMVLTPVAKAGRAADASPGA